MNIPILAKINLILFLILFSQVIQVDPSLTTNKNQSIKPYKLNLFAERYTFSPNKITVPYETNVTITFHSNDTIHGFYLEGYDITQIVCNEHYFQLSFIANKVGTFIYKCNEPACGPYHPYMVGSLTVTPNNQLNIQYIVVASVFIFITVLFLQKWRKLDGN